MDSSNSQFSTGSETQWWGLLGSLEKILVLTWQAMCMPLEREGDDVSAATHGKKCSSGQSGSHDVAVDDLDPALLSGLGGEVEGLGLDAGVLHGSPFEVLFG